MEKKKNLSNAPACNVGNEKAIASFVNKPSQFDSLKSDFAGKDPLENDFLESASAGKGSLESDSAGNDSLESATTMAAIAGNKTETLVESKIDTVLFDLDGTLLDTLQDMTDSVNYVMSTYGLPKHSISAIRSFIGNGIRKLMERSLLAVSADKLIANSPVGVEALKPNKDLSSNLLESDDAILQEEISIDVANAAIATMTEQSADAGAVMIKFSSADKATMEKQLTEAESCVTAQSADPDEEMIKFSSADKATMEKQLKETEICVTAQSADADETMKNVSDLSETFASLVDEATQRYRDYYQNHCIIKTQPYDGILELIQNLKAAGIRLGIVTNKNDEATQKMFQNFFAETIDVCYGQHDGIPKKPDPSMVRCALEALGSVAEHAIYVGDSEVDLQTAANAGMPCITCLWGFRDRDYLAKNGAYIMVEHPSEISTLIL